MDKKEIAAVLEEITVLLELAGENPFKARSYASVAREIELLEEDIEVLAKENRLREIKGVGEALESKLKELVTTGRLQYYENLRAKFPTTLFDLFAIPGLGPKRIKALYEELGIASLGELEYACAENRLAGLKGFGAKMQQRVLEGIAFAKKHRGTHLVNHAANEANALYAWLDVDKIAVRMAVAGSLRRRKEVIRDIDILASAEEGSKLMERFVGFERVERVTGRGPTKSSVVLRSGIAADLRVVADGEFAPALAYFTGSKEHNVVMRQRARERGLKLNEYGLFRGEERIACPDEASIYARLDLPYIPPELRENMGEFHSPIPELVEQKDLVGVFHCHSSYSDGVASVAQMAEAAQARGYGYLALADHSQSAGYAGGLSPEAVTRQHAEIDSLNRRLKNFRILKGIESDIRADGTLDYNEDVLQQFELVIASVHSRMGMTEKDATRRIVKAVENPYTTILGHPTGRLLLSRAGYPLDMSEVIAACAANGVAIEINANPHRLDLDWRYVRRAKEAGVKLCIGPDAHRPEGLGDVTYGLGIARKGWLEPHDLLNCMTLEEFLAWQRPK